MRDSTGSHSTREKLTRDLATHTDALLDLLDEAERQFGHETAVQLSREYGDQIIPKLPTQDEEYGTFLIEVECDEDGNRSPGHWTDLGEGPWETRREAKEYGESEVGVPWRVKEIKP